MLSLEEMRWSFKTLKFFSNLNFHPYKLDEKNGKIWIRSEFNKSRVFRWRISFCLAIAHWLFMFWRLVQSTVLEPEKYFKWEHFILHAPFTFSYCLMHSSGFCIFEEHPAEAVAVFNQLFFQKENPVDKIIQKEQKQKQLIDRIKANVKAEIKGEGGKKSKTESLQVLNLVKETRIRKLSSSIVRPLYAWPPQYMGFFVLVILAVDPSRPQLLYSVLPPPVQNWFSFFLVFLAEAFFLTVVLFIAIFSIVLQLLFFNKCQQELGKLRLQLRDLQEKFQSRPVKDRDFRKEMWILCQILSGMKELEVFIELFNRCFPFCIFAFKIICLAVSILFYFFTIRHFHDFPLLGVFTGYIAMATTLTYSILYQHAFSIPGKMEEIKREFLLTAQKVTIQPTSTTATVNVQLNLNQKRIAGFWAEMKREVREIPDTGIKVGSFHTLEREATPNFIDFVFRNVVSLLVTFPQ